MSQRPLTAFTLATAIALVLTLTACAHRPTPKPPPAGQPVGAKPADTTRATTLTLTSSGMPTPVGFWKSTSPQACADFEPVGRVFHSGREVLLPWIANLTEKANKGLLHTQTSRVQSLAPGVPIQIKGGAGPEDDPRYRSCGPLVTSFTPEQAHRYHVDFAFQGLSSCSQSVMDVTDADHPVAVGRPVACPTGREGVSFAGATKNYLKAEHEQHLGDARNQQAAAVSDADKVSAMKQEAAALDSLGQSKEALEIVDRAIGMVKTENHQDLIATRAGILFSLNDPQGAVTLLSPELDKIRKRAAGQPAAQQSVILGTYTEGFITATFAYMQLEQWRHAIDTLADAQSPLEGPGFRAYRSVLYRYIMTRAQDPSLADATLERDAAYYTDHDSSHYGALLRMWRGDETSLERAAILARMSGADQQEARGEVLFYEGAYQKFVSKHPASANASLADLNRLAPYGSIEWIYGRRVLQ